MASSDRLAVVQAYAFEDWRATARQLRLAGRSPENVHWIDQRETQKEGQQSFFDLPNDPFTTTHDDISKSGTQPTFTVPPPFLELAKTVAHHRSPTRWSLLYRILWRMTSGERHLLQVASDHDVVAARELEKAVRRDAHKMKAFVRFRKTQDEQGDFYVAWHRPDHYVVPYTAGFFSRRFDVMRWAILTPDDSVLWDGKTLAFGPGVARSEQPPADELESLWKTYYSHIFNPARIKLKAMKAEMPMKHWATLPETEVIDELLRKASRRVETMIKQTEGTKGAEPFVPTSSTSSTSSTTIPHLKKAVQTCRGCDLYKEATQAVFGTGPANAKLVMIGEQPGDREDIAGEPFVGPAGDLLRQVLDEVGISIDECYVTNAVKHFKFQMTGTRRLHVKPSAREISACKPWLIAELETIQPAMVLCLGATPASVIFGPAFRVTKLRGEVIETQFARWTMATYHPSALLRVPNADKRASMLREFRQDLQRASDHLKTLR